MNCVRVYGPLSHFCSPRHDALSVPCLCPSSQHTVLLLFDAWINLCGPLTQCIGPHCEFVCSGPMKPALRRGRGRRAHAGECGPCHICGKSPHVTGTMIHPREDSLDSLNELLIRLKFVRAEQPIRWGQCLCTSVGLFCCWPLCRRCSDS